MPINILRVFLPHGPREYITLLNSLEYLLNIEFLTLERKWARSEDIREDPSILFGADDDISAALGGLTRIKLGFAWPGFPGSRMETYIDIPEGFKRWQLAHRVAREINYLMDKFIDYGGCWDGTFSGDVFELSEEMHKSMFYLTGLVNTYPGCWSPIIGTTMAPIKY